MTNTLAAKVMEGFSSQEWEVIGRGGTWSGAMRPLDDYVQRKVERAVKAEREACAKVCEQMDTCGDLVQGWLDYCAEEIRKRGET